MKKSTRRIDRPQPRPSLKLELEEIIGCTTKNASGLSSNARTKNCAYLAGCVVVVYDVISGTRKHFVVSHRIPKPFCCAAMSHDGRFVAAGEFGTQASVIVWDSVNEAFVSELRGHQGVSCISFSPDGKHLASVGGYIHLWEWRNALLAAKVKASSYSSVVSSVSFSSDGRVIVTAGKKHLKFWAIGSMPRAQQNFGTGKLTIHEKPVNINLEKGASFISLASAMWSANTSNRHRRDDNIFPIYVLTDAGVLCLIHSDAMLRKSVNLEVERCFALSSSTSLLACACNNGIVKFFSLEALKYVGRVVYTKANRSHEESNGYSNGNVHQLDEHIPPVLPDARACQFSASEKLVVIYEDHSIYIWDINNVNKAVRCSVLVSHAACIWDVKNLCCENTHDSSLACVARGCPGGVSFATCSADGTIRLWDLDLIYDLSRESTKHNYLKAELMDSRQLVSGGIFEREAVEADIGQEGFRSLAVSSDGKYLAAGDCVGNLHVYDLKTSDYMCFKGAHDAEILTLSFSLPIWKEKMGDSKYDNYYLASAGRDQSINIYDVKRNFDIIEATDDHLTAVTSVKLLANSSKVLSCTADGSVVLRDFSVTDDGGKVSNRHWEIASCGTVYDMAVDPKCEAAVTVGQDKKINVYAITDGKLITSYKQNSYFGDPIKVVIDPSGTYILCSYSNKSICIFEYSSGELVTQAMGHGALITGTIFLPDCKYIVSVDNDGCIFLWRMPDGLSSKILERLMDKCAPLSPQNHAPTIGLRYITCEEVQRRELSRDDLSENKQSEGRARYSSAFRFTVSRLPKWAQSKVASSNVVHVNLNSFSSQDSQSPSSGLKVPSVRAIEGNGTSLSDLSRISPSSSNCRSPQSFQRTMSNIAMDKRWRSVYTVFVDLMTSPDLHNLVDRKISESRSISTAHKAEATAERKTVGQRHHVKNYTNDGSCMFQLPTPRKMNQPCQLKTEKFREDGLVQHHSEERGSNWKKADIKIYNMQTEDDNLFKQHFGSLSTNRKFMQIERRNPSLKKRFSAKYAVHQDYHEECRGLFHSPVIGMAASNRKNFTEEDAAHQRLEEPSFQYETEKFVDCSKQDCKDSAHSFVDSNSTSLGCALTGYSIEGKPLETPLLEGKGGSYCVSEIHEVHEAISACKEALQGLNSAADSVLESFQKLGETRAREELGESRQFYEEASELISSIIGKVNTAAKMVLCSNGDSSGNPLNVSEMEQMLGIFAENLGNRFLEILKKNLNAA